ALDLAFPSMFCNDSCSLNGGENAGLIDVPGTFAPVENFLTVGVLPDGTAAEGGFVIDLLDLSIPVYSSDSGGTTVSVGVDIRARKLDENREVITDPDLASFGTGTFSIDFSGLTPDQVSELFDEPGELASLDPSGDPTVFSYSASFELTSKNVPESSNLIALVGLGLGGTLLAYNRRNKA
ncbi:MAG: hypothetical protein WBM62_23380, partial [Crocosphaera sp.]